MVGVDVLRDEKKGPQYVHVWLTKLKNIEAESDIYVLTHFVQPNVNYFAL